MTLTEFLLARFAEDEAAVQVAADYPGAAEIIARLPNDLFVHVARQGGSPRRVGDDLEAKRAIVQRCLDLIASFGDWDAPEALAAGGRVLWTDVNRRERAHAHDTLHTLANVYADHPDYREEWKP